MQNILFFTKKYAKDLITMLLILTCAGFIGYNYFLIKKSEVKEKDYYDNLTFLNNNPLENETKEEIVQTITPKTINIDIKGAIKKPGVYQVSTESIINDVVKLAGGFKSNAYTNGINLSKKVSDEMVIYIYTKTEVENFNTPKENNSTLTENKICTTSSYNIIECLENEFSIIEVGITSNTTDNKDNNKNTSSTININTANITELTSLTGIGEAKAKIIIEHRENNGLFKSIEDIKNVKGIGEALFEKIKDYITV